MPYDISFAHQMIDAGADIIIGHHPHVIQPMEIYKGKRIYYSLGNSYFGTRRELFKRKFKEEIENQSDYGLGIIWDPSSNDVKEIIIQYNQDKNISEIFPNDNNRLLLQQINIYDKKSYLLKCYRNKRNSNPILGTNKIANYIMEKSYICIRTIWSTIKKQELKNRNPL